ncbi:MAG: hypothetical protein KDA21_04925, partial [Phycisphaerales bacterium]|nr:hypothetical protein [Phycisphaerales bacterium]
MAEQTPMARYLGEFDRRRGPFGLLALPVADCAAADIERALQRRLEQVSRHPHARSPEADEVRLALHVAAAQLRDPGVRAELLQRYNTRAATPSPAGPEPVESDGLFEDIALRILVHSGGWNARSKRRLAAMAHVYGVDEAALERALRALARRDRATPHARGGRTGQPGTSARHTRPTAASARRGRRQRSYVAAIPAAAQRWILLALMVLLILSTLFMAVRVVSLWQHHTGRSDGQAADTVVIPPDMGRDPDEAMTRRDARSDPASDPTRSAADEPEVTEVPERTTAEVAEALRGAVKAVPDDPEAAMTEFERVVGEVSRRWTTIDSATLLAMHGDLVHLTHGAAARLPDQPGRIVEIIAAGDHAMVDTEAWPDAEELRRAVWTAGMLNRLRRQRSLPWRLVDALQDRMETMFPFGRVPGEDGFSTGGAAALEVMATRLIPPAGARPATDEVVTTWEAWLECLAALPEYGATAHQRRLLSTIETILVKGSDPALHESTRRVLLLLMARVDWTDDATAGPIVVQWFDRSDISTSDLTEITSWIVNRGQVPDTGMDMIVAPGITPDERFELRNRYAAAWNLATVSRDEDTATSWARQARDLLQPLPALAPERRLDQVVALARMNLAAHHIYRHTDALALEAMKSAGQPDSRGGGGSTTTIPATATAERLTAPGVPPDGQWALYYLTGGRGSVSRRAMLNQFPSDTAAIGPVDAEVLVQAACFGGSTETSVMAQRLVVRHGSSPAIMNGLLEIAPRLPRQRRVAAMIEDVTGRPLPGEDDPDWRLAVRRTLVEAL